MRKKNVSNKQGTEFEKISILMNERRRKESNKTMKQEKKMVKNSKRNGGKRKKYQENHNKRADKIEITYPLVPMDPNKTR